MLIRRSNDLSQTSSFVPSPQVGIHSDEKFGTHHAADAYQLFNTRGLSLNLFSSAMKVNSQYMHILHFSLKLRHKTTVTKVIAQLEQNDRIALTDKINANEVFSFGRDQGLYGRILNQTVIVEDSINASGGKGVIFNTITVSDGISMGTQGMKYSLVSREVIADSIETVVGCLGYDGLITIGGCDKNMPGCLIGMARLNRPSIFIYGGSIRPSKENTDYVTVSEKVGEFSKGKINEEELIHFEEISVEGPGSVSYTHLTLPTNREV